MRDRDAGDLLVGQIVDGSLERLLLDPAEAEAGRSGRGAQAYEKFPSLKTPRRSDA